MSRYMIRKPEFLKGAEQAAFFPSMFITVLIGICILLAWLTASVIIALIYDSAAARNIMDASSASQTLIIILLMSEGLLIPFTLIHIRYIEKRPLSTAGFIKRGFALKYAAGFGAGFLLIGISMLPVFFIVPVTFTGVKPVAIIFLITFIIQSAGEEALFRGYYMSSMLRRRGALLTLTISNIIFMLLHIFNGYDVLQLSGVTLLGVVLGLYMLRDGSVWGAMGMHAAWNFFTLSIISTPTEPYQIEYAFFYADVSGNADILLTLIQLAVMLTAIALLLFAGKKRLVVIKPKMQIRYEKALKLTKSVLGYDKATLGYALRVAELAQGEASIAALLYHTLSYGASPGYIGQEFGEEMQNATAAMKRVQGEGPKEYWERIIKYPAAFYAKQAETRLDEIKRPKVAANPGIWFAGGCVQCPMLRWGIEEEHCRQTARYVDGRTADGGFIDALDHGVCRRCPGRQLMGSMRRGSADFLQRYGARQ